MGRPPHRNPHVPPDDQTVRRPVGRPRLNPRHHTVVLNIRVTEGDLERLRVVARREDRPVSAQGRRLLLAGLATAEAR